MRTPSAPVLFLAVIPVALATLTVLLFWDAGYFYAHRYPRIWLFAFLYWFAQGLFELWVMMTDRLEVPREVFVNQTLRWYMWVPAAVALTYLACRLLDIENDWPVPLVFLLVYAGGRFRVLGVMFALPPFLGLLAVIGWMVWSMDGLKERAKEVQERAKEVQERALEAQEKMQERVKEVLPK